MAEPLVSADKKYYASKEPLLFRGTKEGRKSPRPNPSYQQKSADVTASADKYYKAMSPIDQPSVTQPASKRKPVAGQPVELPATGKVLVGIVQALQAGVTDIIIKGQAADIVKARAVVDMAVGRNTLTRAQADFVSYITVLPKESEGKVPEGKGGDGPQNLDGGEPEKLVQQKKVTKKKVTKKKKATKKKTPKKAADVVQRSTSEADDILNPPKDDDDSITEDDIADAFGVNDDSNDADDDEFDDDSDD